MEPDVKWERRSIYINDLEWELRPSTESAESESVVRGLTDRRNQVEFFFLGYIKLTPVKEYPAFGLERTSTTKDIMQVARSIVQTIKEEEYEEMSFSQEARFITYATNFLLNEGYIEAREQTIDWE